MRKIFVALFIVAVVTAGCSSTPTKDQEGAAVEDLNKPAPPTVVDRKPVVPLKPDATTKPFTPGDVGSAALKDPKNILSKRSVYFDYDSNSVKDEFKPLVSAHARYLSQNRGAKTVVQGNTDERGSREYNLALGQRRADAVKQMMQLLGASSPQIETVSFGEEKPRGQGNDEKAMAENRRADIVYEGE